MSPLGRRCPRRSHALLGPVNVLLRDEPDAEIVPIADRSYQLYGDEKHLKDIARHHLVAKGLLDVATHLRARPTPAPLAMFELGPAPWMLIVENTAAFTSLREILGAWSDRGQVGWLGFGSGDQLVASIPTALASFRERDHPADTLLMYADLDVDGLHCAQQASHHAQTVGLPPLLPATGLYKALLRAPTLRSARHSRRSTRCGRLAPAAPRPLRGPTARRRPGSAAGSLPPASSAYVAHPGGTLAAPTARRSSANRPSRSGPRRALFTGGAVAPGRTGRGCRLSRMAVPISG